MGPKFGGSVSATAYIDHCGIYIYWHCFTWILIIQNNRCQFQKLTQIWCWTTLLLSKLYSIILLINIYVNIPNSFNILSKAARLLLKKLIHILKSYCDWADLSTLLFDLLCSLRFLYKMYFRWKVLKFTSITKTFH